MLGERDSLAMSNPQLHSFSRADGAEKSTEATTCIRCLSREMPTKYQRLSGSRGL